MSYILATRKHTEFLRHAVSSILFSTKYNLFHNFLFFLIKHFFINHAIKLEHQHGWIKVNDFCGKDSPLCYVIFFKSNNLSPRFTSYAASKVLLKKPKTTKYFPQYISPQTKCQYSHQQFIH